MKKLLVASTALVAVASINAAQAADPIKLSITGRMAQLVSYADNDDIETAGTVTATRKTEEFDVKGISEVNLAGSTKLDNGLTVSVRWELEGDNYNDNTMDESFLTVSSDTMGALVLGAEKHQSDNIAVSAPMAGAPVWNNETTFATFISAPAGFTSFTGTADGNDSYKVGYVSPSFGGLRIVASASPEDFEGDSAAAIDISAGDAAGYSAGLAYSGDFDGVGVNFAASTYQTTHGLDQTRVGATVSVAGFTFGGDYTKAGWANNEDAGKTNDGRAFNIGASYATGPYTVALTYLDGEREGTAAATNANEDQSKVWNLGLNYSMGAGVTLLGNVLLAEYEGEDNTVTTDDKDGWAVITGVALSF